MTTDIVLLLITNRLVVIHPILVAIAPFMVYANKEIWNVLEINNDGTMQKRGSINIVL